MLNIAAEHIEQAEAKERQEKARKAAEAERLRQIGHLQQVIAEAERKMIAPIFAHESTNNVYVGMQRQLEQQANDYESRLWHNFHAGRGFKLDLSEDGAIAFFCKDSILAKLPGLAAKISSRDFRGEVLDEAKREAIIAECKSTIADAREKLAALNSVAL